MTILNSFINVPCPSQNSTLPSMGRLFTLFTELNLKTQGPAGPKDIFPEHRALLGMGCLQWYFIINFFINIPCIALINSTGGFGLLAQIGKSVCHAHVTNIAMRRRLMKSKPMVRFSKVPETFRARKAKAKSRTLLLQSCFTHTFLI